MERLTGRVHTVEIADPAPGRQRARRGAGTRRWPCAQLHAVDPAKVDAMAEFLRTEPYAERQLRRWAGQWERARAATGLDGEPVLDRVFAWLAANRPPVPPPRVVHGDYGFANVMFDPTETTRVQAILDWELTAVGDALADLGSLIAYQSRGGPADERRPARSGVPSETCCPPCRPCRSSSSATPSRAATRASPTSPGTSLRRHQARVIVAGALNRHRTPGRRGAPRPLDADGARSRRRGRGGAGGRPPVIDPAVRAAGERRHHPVARFANSRHLSALHSEVSGIDLPFSSVALLRLLDDPDAPVRAFAAAPGGPSPAVAAGAHARGERLRDARARTSPMRAPACSASPKPGATPWTASPTPIVLCSTKRSPGGTTSRSQRWPNRCSA